MSDFKGWHDSSFHLYPKFTVGFLYILKIVEFFRIFLGFLRLALMYGSFMCDTVCSPHNFMPPGITSVGKCARCSLAGCEDVWAELEQMLRHESVYTRIQHAILRFLDGIGGEEKIMNNIAEHSQSHVCTHLTTHRKYSFSINKNSILVNHFSYRLIIIITMRRCSSMFLEYFWMSNLDSSESWTHANRNDCDTVNKYWNPSITLEANFQFTTIWVCSLAQLSFLLCHFRFNDSMNSHEKKHYFD